MQSIDHPDSEKGMHFLDLLIILARQRKLLILTPVVTGALVMIASLLMTPMFLSTAKVLPPQSASSGLSAMLGQLGGLASAAGAASAVKNPNDLYVGLLESRTVADHLIERFALVQRYETSNMDDTRRALASLSEFSGGKKDGMISISAMDKDPKFAADLANGYVDELAKLTQSMALTEASQRRLFFEKQLNEAKSQLANAEVGLQATQEKTGMIQPEAQVQAIIANVAQLRGTIAAKEVQLNAMRTFAANQNPELLRGQEELRSLRAQLAKLEKNQSPRDADFMVPTGKIPAVGVEYVRSLREVKYYETIFELLAKQYELAKVDEAKNSSMIQLLDKAIPADRKAKPKRAVMVLGGVFGGIFLGLLLAFVVDAIQRSRRDPTARGRWQEFATAWKKVPHPQS